MEECFHCISHYWPDIGYLTIGSLAYQAVWKSYIGIENIVPNRRLARERLEYYLVYLILAYRHLLLIVGLLLLVYALAIMSTTLLAGTATLLPAVFLLLLSNSFHVVLHTARLGAWLGTLWKCDD